MADYRKFDSIAAAEECDEEESNERRRDEQLAARRERLTEEHGPRREAVDAWLKGALRRLFPPEDPTAPPELEMWEDVEPRRVTDDERGVLAMFLAVTYCPVNQMNLGCHHEILELVRTNRWLEEDPGTVELLCQLTRSVNDWSQKDGAEAGCRKGRSDGAAGGAASQPIPLVAGVGVDEVLLNGVNTLSAAGRTGHPRLQEFFAAIGEPGSKADWDSRERYIKKEFAAEALIDSMMPKAAPEDRSPLFGAGEWAALVLVLLVMVGLVAFAGVNLLGAWFEGGTAPAPAVAAAAAHPPAAAAAQGAWPSGEL